MAIAVQALRGARAVAGVGRGAARGLPSGGQPGHAGIGIRLIWAGAAGLVVLELISLATGRFWDWNFGAPFHKLTTAPRPYTPLPTGAVPDPATLAFLGASGALIAQNQATAPDQRRQPSASGPGPVTGP